MSEITGSKFFITVAAMLAALMAILDISIVNVALDQIRAGFGVQLDQIAWVSTGYMMANVIVIPMTGWFQKKFGLRNYFVFSVILFTFASILCGLAWNLESMTIFRILQGAGGGAIIPTASTILMSRYPRHEQGMAQSFIGLGAITGPLLGPFIGGYLIDQFNWHMIFLINIPFGIMAAALAYNHIEEVRIKFDHVPMDYIGFALLAVGLGSLQFVLEEGNRKDWFQEPYIVVMSVVSVVCLITLIVQQIESRNPMIDFKVFLDRNYLLSTIVNFLLGIALFSAGFLFSLFCSVGLKYEPIQIGEIFLKGCLIQFITMPLVGKMVPKVDNRLLILFGVIVTSFSIWLNAHVNQRFSANHLTEILFLRSFGLGFVFIPLSVMAISHLKTKDIGNAIGLFSLTRELGGSIGLAWMSTQLVNHIKISTEALRMNLNKGSEMLNSEIAGLQASFLGRTIDHVGTAYKLIQLRVAGQATILAFDRSFMALSFVFGTSCILVLFFRKGGVEAPPPIH